MRIYDYEESYTRRGSRDANPSHTVGTSEQQEKRIAAFHACWHAIHTEEWSTEQWLIAWEQALPRVGCDCDRWYQEWKEANPPPLGNARECRIWGFRLHNAVNGKLLRREWSVEEAIARWTVSAETN